MKKTTFGLVAVLAFFSLQLIAVNPDFSGSWIRDQANSDKLGTLRDGMILSVTADLLVIQEGNKLRVETHWSDRPTVQRDYIVDGNENLSSGGREGDFTYRATWIGDSLTIEGILKVKTPFGPAEMKKREEWSLSADGKTLTIVTRLIDSNFGNESRKQVYNKKLP